MYSTMYSHKALYAPRALTRVCAVRRNKPTSALVRILRDLTICLLLLFPYLLLPVG